MPSTPTIQQEEAIFIEGLQSRLLGKNPVLPALAHHPTPGYIKKAKITMRKRISLERLVSALMEEG